MSTSIRNLSIPNVLHSYRIAFINEEGTCLIGVGRKGLIPLLTFDIVINVYLTILFSFRFGAYTHIAQTLKVISALLRTARSSAAVVPWLHLLLISSS